MTELPPLKVYSFSSILINVQSNFDGSNIFWTMEICSRYG